MEEYFPALDVKLVFIVFCCPDFSFCWRLKCVYSSFYVCFCFSFPYFSLLSEHNMNISNENLMQYKPSSEGILDFLLLFNYATSVVILQVVLLVLNRSME